MISPHFASAISRAFLTLAFLLACSAVFNPAPAEAGELFANHPSPTASTDIMPGRAPEPTLVRERAVTVDMGNLADMADRTVAGMAGVPVSLNLFPDVRHDFIPEKTERSRDGKFRILTGSIAGGEPFVSGATFVFGDGVAVGNIRPGWGTRIYQVRLSPSGVSVVRELDETRFPSELDPLPPTAADAAKEGSASTSSRGADAPATAADDGSTINVMVAYTPSARAAEGGTAAMQALINLGVSETNQGYANSGVTQRISLAHSYEVTYTESAGGAGFSKALTDVTGTADGNMDDIHGVRNTYAADMVSLWINNSAYCGLAYLMTTAAHSFESSAFSVVHYSCATGYYSFGHEMGHNQGAHHDTYVAPENGVYSYSHGYTDTTNQFRTVMAYNDACTAVGKNCSRINYWSNPSVTYTGAVTGDANANNTLSHNNTYSVAANWRYSNITLSVSKNGGTGTVTADSGAINCGATCSGVYDSATTVTLTATPDTWYAVASWTGCSSSSGNTCTVTFDSQTSTASVTVNFQSVQPGNLTVNLAPAGAVTAGAQWNVDGGSWQNSGTTVSDLGSGAHTVSFKGCIDGYSEPVDQTVTITAGQTTTTTGTYTAHGSSVTVTLPVEIVNWGGLWTIAGCENTRWYESGQTATHGGSGSVVFSGAPGYEAPASIALSPGATVIGAGQTTHAATTQPSQPGFHGGQIDMTVNLLPTRAAVDGAKWSLDSGSIWYDSGQTVSAPKSYTLTFKPTAGWKTPLSRTGSTTTAVTVNVPYGHEVSDFDKDGKSDVVFRNGTTGQVYLWNMSGATITGGGYAAMNPGVGASPGVIVGQGDFSGDGASDLLFENPSTKAFTIWLMTGTTSVSSTGTLTINPARTATEIIGGVADFDGDGKADILLVETAPAGNLQPRILFMNGLAITASTNVNISIPQTLAAYGDHTGWHVAALADFDADGNADILWRFANQTDTGDWSAGQTSIWYMDGATKTSGGQLPSQLGAYQNTTGGASPFGWLIQAVGDFNGDGYTDILFRNAGGGSTPAGTTALWLMQGQSGGTPVKLANGSDTASVEERGSGKTVDGFGTVLNGGAFTETGGWHIIAAGDCNGDGKDDILWRYMGTGHIYVWTMNGRTATGASFTSVYPGTATGSGWNAQIMRTAFEEQ